MFEDKLKLKQPNSYGVYRTGSTAVWANEGKFYGTFDKGSHVQWQIVVEITEADYNLVANARDEVERKAVRRKVLTKYVRLFEDGKIEALPDPTD